MGHALRVIEGDQRPALALELPEQTTFGEWLGIGRRLRLGSQALNWHIGDWWKFGVSHWGEDETRKSALEIWGVEGETARVYGWVATKFDPVNRVTDLSFTHYQRAASLPIEDAKRIIAKAAAESLTVRDVQREVQAIKAANDPEPLVEESVSSQPPQIDPAQVQLGRLIGAWNQAGISVRRLFAQLVVESDTVEIEQGCYDLTEHELPIDAFSSAEKLATVARGPVLVAELLFAIAEGDGEIVRLIRSDQKDEETNRLRRAVIFVAKMHANASFPEIGRVIGRDHSVVLRSYRKARVMQMEDPAFRDLCGRLRMLVW